jgi:hypothetical protein
VSEKKGAPMLIRLVLIVAGLLALAAPRAHALPVVPPFDVIIPAYDPTPVRLHGWAWLIAPDCRWAMTLLASPGPFTTPCDGLTVNIETTREPTTNPETPMWLTVESPGGTGEAGVVWRASRMIPGGKTETFALPLGLPEHLQITLALPTELHLYDFTLHIEQPERSRPPISPRPRAGDACSSGARAPRGWGRCGG